MTSRDRSGASRARSACAALAAVVVLAGCSEPSGSAAGEAGSPTPRTSATPGGDASTAAPASGKPVDTTYFTTRVPEGFDVDVEDPDFSVYATDAGGETEIDFTLVPTNGNDFSLDQLAHQVLRTQTWSRRPAIAPETSVDGEPAYHLSGPVGDGRRTEAYGAAYRDMHVVVVIDSSLPRPRLRELADSVLAGWRWK